MKTFFENVKLSDPDININLTDFDLEMKMFCVGTVFKVSVGVKVTSSPSHKYSFPLSSISYSLFTLKGELHYFFTSARFLIVELLLECRKCKTNK
jgi:hypothetical protein